MNINTIFYFIDLISVSIKPKFNSIQVTKTKREREREP